MEHNNFKIKEEFTIKFLQELTTERTASGWNSSPSSTGLRPKGRPVSLKNTFIFFNMPIIFNTYFTYIKKE